MFYFAPTCILYIFTVFPLTTSRQEQHAELPQYLSCSSMCRAKLIGYTGCPDPSLSGVISLYFVAVVLWPSSFCPSVALTCSTLPPICSKLTTASITLVTIFGIVEVPTVLHCREGPAGLVWASLWYVMNLPHGWDNWIALLPTHSVCWRARRDLWGIYVSVFSPCHNVPTKQCNYLLIFSSGIKASFLLPCLSCAPLGRFVSRPSIPSSFIHLSSLPLDFSCSTFYTFLLQLGIDYLSEVRAEVLLTWWRVAILASESNRF